MLASKSYSSAFLPNPGPTEVCCCVYAVILHKKQKTSNKKNQNKTKTKTKLLFLCNTDPRNTQKKKWRKQSTDTCKKAKGICYWGLRFIYCYIKNHPNVTLVNAVQRTKSSYAVYAYMYESAYKCRVRLEREGTEKETISIGRNGLV